MYASVYIYVYIYILYIQIYTYKRVKLQIVCRNSYFELKKKYFTKHFLGYPPSIRY